MVVSLSPSLECTVNRLVLILLCTDNRDVLKLILPSIDLKWDLSDSLSSRRIGPIVGRMFAMKIMSLDQPQGLGHLSWDLAKLPSVQLLT